MPLVGTYARERNEFVSLTMRFGLSIILIILAANTLNAQDSRTVRALREEADHYYEDEQYNLAIQDYRELADQNVQDASISFRLAECYRKTFNYADAEAYYLKVFYLSPIEFPLSLYYYALMLKFNGNFDEAINSFDRFIAVHNGSKNLSDFVEQAFIDKSGCETAKEELKEDKNLYPQITLNLNTAYNDFAPAVRDSTTIVISSGRIFSNRQTIDERFGEAFTDNYYFEKEGNNWVDKTRQVFAVTNSKYNDGSGSFNTRGDKYYFTVCGADGPQCKIFLSELKNNKWTTPVELNSNINFRTFESRQPAISHGGDSLVFASNRPGGAGGFDLWMSVNSGGDNWGPAMNLGPMINTKLNELSPILTTFPNILFFSSDGHEGFGGLDLYMSKRMSTGELILYNLGSPFNSNRDDCFMSFSDRELYWSSNRQGGKGGFDITGATIQSVPSFISRIGLKKRNARRDINLKIKTEEAQARNLQASRLDEKISYESLTYEKKKVVDEMVANQSANIPIRSEDYKLPAGEFARLKAIAEDRYNQVGRREKGYLTRIAARGSAEDVEIIGILKDSVSGKALTEVKVLLTSRGGEVIKITKTNAEGKFRFTGVDSNELFLRLDKDPQGGVVPVISGLSLIKTVENTIAQLDNIYFDFDHYRIRPEAQRVLDDLAVYLKNNPGAQLEIFAFADDRGTNEYNLQLTQKRGQSVVDYLARKGVDQTGLAISAKGKQAPRQVDVELQRQYNRRVEFYLYGNKDFKESARTYIIRKKTDWKTLSVLTGVSITELKTANGFSGDEPLNAFQPVRLPVTAKVNSADAFFLGF